MNNEPFDIRQLQAFAAVIAAGSITGAARVLARSQSLVTRTIQDLEAQLGYALFRRNGPQITPTEEGIQFHEEVERLLVGLKYLRNRADAIGQKTRQSFEVSGIPALSVGLMIPVLAALEATLPTRVHLHSTTTHHVIQSLLTRTSDLGCTSLPIDHAGITIHWVGKANSVVVLADNDPLSAKAEITAADLADTRIITMANPYRLRHSVERALAKANVTPVAVLETNSSLNALAAVQSGLGRALIEPVTAYGMRLPGTVVKPFRPAIPFYFAVVSNASVETSPESLQMIEALEVRARALLPDFEKYDIRSREELQRILGEAVS